MKTDAIGHFDDGRRDGAARFVGSCVCAFCAHATAFEVLTLGPRLESLAREYAAEEMGGFGRAAKEKRDAILAIVLSVRKGRRP